MWQVGVKGDVAGWSEGRSSLRNQCQVITLLTAESITTKRSG